MTRTLLSLLQLSDSAFPTGSFSHSLGLEAQVASGLVDDEPSLEAAVSHHLDALATSDCAALRGAAEADSLGRVVAVDRALAATKLARESRDASAAMGRSTLDAAAAIGIADPRLHRYRELVQGGEAPGGQAVCFGLTAGALGIPVHEAVCAYTYAAAAALVAAGQKLIPLGQRAAQRLLLQLRDPIAAAVTASASVEPTEPFAFAPTVEVASMTHERLQPRLYIS